jgi:hypothetical protein
MSDDVAGSKPGNAMKNNASLRCSENFLQNLLSVCEQIDKKIVCIKKVTQRLTIAV